MFSRAVKGLPALYGTVGQGLDLDSRSRSRSRLPVPAQGKETKASRPEGQVALLASIKLEWALDGLCGFSHKFLTGMWPES